MTKPKDKRKGKHTTLLEFAETLYKEIIKWSDVTGMNRSVITNSGGGGSTRAVIVDARTFTNIRLKVIQGGSTQIMWVYTKAEDKQKVAEQIAQLARSQNHNTKVTLK